ncbi:hypothetical protein ACWDYH_07290 [Nocardia goodfellowii]
MNERVRSDGFYDQTSEYVAVLIAALWDRMGPAVVEALASGDTTHPIVDVGAGPGDAAAAVVRGLPDVPVVAIEPNLALRTALLARVVRDSAMAARVTVVDSGFLTARAELPEVVSGFVLANVLGHFTAEERKTVWSIIAERLSPRGRVVLTLAPPTQPEVIPETPMSEVAVGERRYRGAAAAQPAGPDAVVWRMGYAMVADGAIRDQFTAEDIWYVLDGKQLAAEVAEFGLWAEEVDSELALWVLGRDARP